MAKIKFTAGRVDAFPLFDGQKLSFLWDTVAPGLGLRATPNGGKSYVFQAKLNGAVIRIKIGDPKTWDIASAQAEARRLKVIIDSGQDPRQVKADTLAAAQAARDAKAAASAAAEAEDEAARSAAAAAALRKSVTLGDVWPEYVNSRKAKWSAGHLRNHINLASPGGQTKKRGSGLTVAGPMFPLMSIALVDLNGTTVAEWLDKEARERPTNAAQSYRLLRAFMRWCADIPKYRDMVPVDAYSARAVRDVLPKSQAKDGDSLQREQLRMWFDAVQKIRNPVISGYLQGLLLTGARREELAALRWDDVDFQWRSLKIHDKVEGQRSIPLTPYLAHLLSTLPRLNHWVFSSHTSADGKLAEPRIAHTRALAAAGLPHISLHGLRRSFGTLCEWVEMPSGISAQIMGHKPSALAEKHYRRRPLDLLRKWHDRIETWILNEAGLAYQPVETSLRVVRVA